MSYTIPLNINGEVIGFIGIDMGIEELRKQVKDIKVYNTGYAFMINRDYSYLAHNSLDEKSNLKTIDGGKLSYIVDEVEANDKGVIDSEFAGEDKTMAFAKLRDGRILFLTAAKSEIFEDMQKTIYIIIGTMIAVSLVAILASMYLGKKISEPIEHATFIIERTSRLDLTDCEEIKKTNKMFTRKDEIGSIFRAISLLKQEMRGIINAIEETTESVVTNTGSLTVATDETTMSINEVSKTVEELANATMEQASDTEEGANILARLSEDIKLAINEGQTVVNGSIEAQKINGDGIKSINTMVGTFNDVNESSNVLAQNIDSLSDKSQSIEDILKTIVEISEQTNLLALNAAIEAARAGEAGRGFAVVADEIRQLSEETGNATENIGQILNTIQDEVSVTKDNMNSSKYALGNANKSLDETKQAFEKTTEIVTKTIESVKQLEEKLDVVDKDKDIALTAIQNISTIAEESAASTEELSASMEEQSAAMETISSNTDNLSAITENLRELVHKFKL